MKFDVFLDILAQKNAYDKKIELNVLVQGIPKQTAKLDFFQTLQSKSS